MPYFWEYPSVSMGLAPIMAIYQARFNEYLRDRGIKDTAKQKVWAFLGDGECDEPETLGAITLASRERLENLIFVINCNLQRLDGPVRGNGKIIQELESLFRGAGWNVIKCVWGSSWDELLERDKSGLLLKRMGEVVDGEYQKYTLMPGSYIREHFFGKYPELLELVKDYTDEDIERLRRGGHDPQKVYAAFERAARSNGRPTVILAKTIKGYGLGDSAEGQNVAHNKKKLEKEDLIAMRNRFGIPLSDEQASLPALYKPPESSPEMKYLRSRREALGGYVPTRPTESPKTDVPTLAEYSRYLAGSKGREVSTTFGFVELLRKLVKDKKIGKNVVPIVPDESRTFGMEGMFREIGIYAHAGQLYEPVDADQLQYYKEAQDGQILEEGINEAGSMASFIAAGTAYSAHGVNMIPFYIYYSMFGFQRVGDLIWAAADARAKGFLLGGTAGRTTLNGEGLQHQDGHSLLNAIAFPTVRAYDPAFNYETTVIIMDGLKKLYAEGETAIYYLMVGNEPYEQFEMPQGIEEGIVRGLYKFRTVEAGKKATKVVLLGSGAIMNCVLKAQSMLAETYGISSDVWSVPSYTELRRDAHQAERWNMLHPAETPKKSYVEECFEADAGRLFVSASDYVRALGEQIKPFVPGDYYVLGTDGMGRSESRKVLRRHFEVDAESIVLATLYRLSRRGEFPVDKAAAAVKDLGIDPNKIDPYFA
jgi:pyruvate dehydrogenase E1 component